MNLFPLTLRLVSRPMGCQGLYQPFFWLQDSLSLFFFSFLFFSRDVRGRQPKVTSEWLVQVWTIIRHLPTTHQTSIRLEHDSLLQPSLWHRRILHQARYNGHGAITTRLWSISLHDVVHCHPTPLAQPRAFGLVNRGADGFGALAAQDDGTLYYNEPLTR